MPPEFMPTAFSLIAVACWGVSDFLGGLASRKSDAFLVTLTAHVSGFSLMLGLTVLNHASIPTREEQLWALAAGALGGSGLALFYSALGSGRMGVAAPLASILGAGIPTLFGIAVQGFPGPVPVIGFVLAGFGIWLLSRPDASAGHDGLLLAVVAGIGFAGFFICIDRTGNASGLWSAVYSRFASIVMVGAIIVVRRRAANLAWKSAAIGLFAGALDSTGTLLFIRADQTGRLDSAVMLTSLYPVVTVLLARFVLKEHFTRWKAVGILTALAAVPLIAKH